MEDSTLKYLKLLNEYKALLTVAILICSFVFQTIYYWYFNVNIIDYLELNELILLLLKDSFKIILFFAIPTYIFIKYKSSVIQKWFRKIVVKIAYFLAKKEDYMKFLDSINVDDENYFNNNQDKYERKIFYTQFLVIAIIDLLVAGISLLPFILNYSNKYLYLISTFFTYVLGPIIVFYLMQLLISILSKQRTIIINSLRLWCYTVISYVLFYSIFMGLFQETFVFSKYTFIVGNKKVITNDTLIVIGKTKNYLFLNNVKTRTTTIYKNEDISKITIDNFDNKKPPEKEINTIKKPRKKEIDTISKPPQTNN